VMQQKGFALASILVIMVVIMVGVTTLLQSMSSQAGMRTKGIAEIRAQYAAEAGLVRANWQCRTNPLGCQTEPFDATDDVQITATPQGGGIFQIRVQANYPDR
jgi:Tfp pilus assembly protein PilX